MSHASKKVISSKKTPRERSKFARTLGKWVPQCSDWYSEAQAQTTINPVEKLLSMITDLTTKDNQLNLSWKFKSATNKDYALHMWAKWNDL